MIPQADKDGSIVILDSGLYYHLNLCMLSDTNTYQKQDNDPTVCFQTELQKLLSEGISLCVISHIAIFHSTPKVHKNIFPPPMRPIITGVGLMNELLGAWVDNYLQPLIQKIPGYLQDTRQVLNMLNKQVSHIVLLGHSRRSLSVYGHSPPDSSDCFRVVS